MPWSKAEQNRAYFAFLMLATHRHQSRTDEEAAKQCGFQTTEALHTQLRNWGFPEWLIAKNPADQEKSIEAGDAHSTESKKDKAKRKTRAGGRSDTRELPPAEGAAELFRREITSQAAWDAGGVHRVVGALEDLVAQLPSIREGLYGELFSTASLIEGEVEYFHKSMYPRETWEVLCKKYSVDPSVTEFYAPLEAQFYPEDAKPAPWQGLVQLIAVYALRHGSLEPLLEKLHPNPSSADRQGLEKDVKNLRLYARRIATRVRGGSQVRRGAPTPEISMHDIWIKWFLIDPRHREGKSDQQILDELKAKGFLGEDYPLNELTRLRSLNLPQPG